MLNLKPPSVWDLREAVRQTLQDLQGKHWAQLPVDVLWRPDQSRGHPVCEYPLLNVMANVLNDMGGHIETAGDLFKALGMSDDMLRRWGADWLALPSGGITGVQAAEMLRKALPPPSRTLKTLATRLKDTGPPPA